MSETLTGGFPIGFRYAPLSEWSRDLPGLIRWAKENGFSALDTGRDGADAAAVVEAGLRSGSADLPEWQGVLSLDAATRRDAVAKNSALVEQNAAAGPLNYFVVMLPEDPDAPPQEVFRTMVDAYTALAPTLEAHNAKIVIEGWPGPGALVSTCSSRTTSGPPVSRRTIASATLSSRAGTPGSATPDGHCPARSRPGNRRPGWRQ